MNAISLWKKHRSLARKASSRFTIPGSSREDVIQEAEIALWEAAVRFDPGRGCSFPVFANIVIVRHLTDCLKTATRGSQSVLTAAGRDEEMLALPHLHQVSDFCEEREDLRRLVAAIKTLSVWQQHCVIGVASGLSYAQLGPSKHVDTTLYRARKKLREQLSLSR